MLRCSCIYAPSPLTAKNRSLSKSSSSVAYGCVAGLKRFERHPGYHKTLAYGSFFLSIGLGGIIPVTTASVGLGVVSCVALLSFLDRWVKGAGVDVSVWVLGRALSLSARRSPVDLARVGDAGDIVDNDGGMDGEAMALLLEIEESKGTVLIPEAVERVAVGVLVLAESHGWEGLRKYSGEAGLRLSLVDWDSKARVAKSTGETFMAGKSLTPGAKNGF